jgi:choline dehydrogenase-like flavoprotein
MESLQMIIDLETTQVVGEINCDVAIVGAGAVGIAMAAELAGSGLDVILLEAGGTGLESSSQELYNAARSVGHPLPGLHEGRFRLLGGTTNFWGGQLVRFDPIVFEERSWLPYSGWPFGRDELDPFYERLFDLLQLRCIREDDAVWRRLNMTAPDLGEHLDLFFTRWLPNPNFAQLFRGKIEGDQLRVFVHANVTAIDPAETAEAPVRLQLQALNGTQGKVRARFVVLSCGTIEIARLLQFPLASGASAPWGDGPWLGRGFVDHVDCFAGKVKPINPKAFHDLFDNAYFDGYKYNPKVKLSDAAQRRDRLLGISAQFAFHSDISEHLANLKLFLRALTSRRMPRDFWKLPTQLWALWRVALPLAARYLRSSRAFNPADRGIELRLTGEQFPCRDSSIRLGEDRDRLGQLDGRELETLAQFAERLDEAFRTCGIASIEIDPLLRARDPAFLDRVDDGFHQMGGARIGRTKADGVVDPNLAVHGTHGLYVAGAAVFPSTGFPNPTLTAMALGLRLADHLRKAA